jgi:hypothetical protein
MPWLRRAGPIDSLISAQTKQLSQRPPGLLKLGSPKTNSNVADQGTEKRRKSGSIGSKEKYALLGRGSKPVLRDWGVVDREFAGWIGSEDLKGRKLQYLVEQSTELLRGEPKPSPCWNYGVWNRSSYRNSPHSSLVQ